MIQVVDRLNGLIVQKVMHNKTGKVVRYQTVPEDKIGNTSAVQCHPTLTEARKFCAEQEPS